MGEKFVKAIVKNHETGHVVIGNYDKFFMGIIRDTKDLEILAETSEDFLSVEELLLFVKSAIK